MIATNPLLSQIMKQLRSGASLIGADLRSYARLDRAAGDTFAQVWFHTQGCTWAGRGSCTMCNYGHGTVVSGKQMVAAVDSALQAIQVAVDELFVSPSGSMLDPMEVPPEARLAIYQRMAAFSSPKVLIETRPETVTTATARELATVFAGKAVAVEMGLESSSSWIQRFCINKGTDPKEFCRAATLLKKHGIRVYANISVGTPFLTARETIDDACRSARWALAHGADVAVVFPLHVKPFTLLEWLYDRGLYQPPSLWALIEVLAGVDPILLPQITISWYRDNYGPAADLVQSPTTCTRCRSRVLRLLDRFRESPSRLTLEALMAEECDCKVLWREEVASAPGKPLVDRVLQQYDFLAEAFGLLSLWRELRAEALVSDPWRDG